MTVRKLSHIRTRGAENRYNKSIKQTHLRNMRKIESQMNQAIRNNEDFKSSNTRVIYSPIRNTSEVYLHDNLIAIQSDEGLQVFDGGWQSNTTKSRLNALIDEFANAFTDGVFQKNFTWYVRDNNQVKEFDNGYIFA